MYSKVKQTSVKDLNPVLSVAKDGIILYSNQASEPILDEWGVIVGEKLPSFIRDTVQRVISRKSAEKIEVKVGNKLYLVVFHPVPEQECVSISGFDITEHKRVEMRLASDVTVLRRLYELQAKMATETDLGRAIDEILAATCDFAHTDRATMQLVREDGIFEIVAQRGYAENSPFITYFREGGFEEGCHKACRERIQIIIEDAVNCPGLAGTEGGDITIGDGVLAAQSTPLVSHGGTAIGVLSTQYRHPYRPSDEEMGLMKQLAFLAADFIERHRAEKALKESEERFRLLFENMNEGFFLAEIICDDLGKPIDYRHLIVNPVIEQVIGMKREDIVGKTRKEALMTASPWIEAFGKVALTGQPVTFEGFSDGLNRHYLIHAYSPQHSHFACLIQDITARKKAEESLAKIELIRKKETHHRIKNNLQVISSLLDLQAEKFKNREYVMGSEALETFKESQNRVISMALIHEELNKGEGFEKLNFSSYIKGLVDNLFLTYRLENKKIILNTDLDVNAFLDIENVVLLGIIINELVSNSLKYAFPGKNDGEIRVKFRREEGSNNNFILTISDNGVGIPEDIDIENPNSLGLQLVTTLVDQLNGELELNRNKRTEFTVRFTIPESNNPESEESLLQLNDND